MTERAQYSSDLPLFLEESAESVLGKLTSNSAHNVELPQRNAWMEEIRVLKHQLGSFRAGHIFLEFSIPRMGKRADAILLLGG